ncbi:hypothetical protein ACPV5U_19550 [Vibrio mediterranei]
MKGQIISHDYNGRFGYVVDAADNQSYRFSYSNCDKATLEQLKDGLYVSFSTRAVSDGYEAVSLCMLNTDSFLYEVPSKLLVTQGSKIADWELMNEPEWIVMGSSEESSSKAKQQCINLCQTVGATGAIKLTYSTSTERKGNYRYNVHHYSAVPVRLARKSPVGNLRRQRVGMLLPFRLKQRLIKKTRVSRFKAISWYALAVGTGLITDNVFVLLVGLLLCLWFVRMTNYDSWLQPIRATSSGQEWESL